MGTVVIVRKDGSIEKRPETKIEREYGIITYDDEIDKAFAEETMSDAVNHPAHYTQGKIEVADFIDDQKLDWKEASIIQYVCRWKLKGGVRDLMKARWYIDRLIEQADATQKKASAEK